DQPWVIIGPARSRQFEQELPLGVAPRRLGRRVDEDMQVIESTEQADMTRLQHAVAEHIARHVTDAHYGEVGGLDVDAEFAEMALYELPDAPRGDAHCLVVVPHRAAGGECVAEPIPVFSRDRVGEIGEL